MKQTSRRKSCSSSRIPVRRRGPACRKDLDVWLNDVLSHLASWQARGTLQDCPLSELYRVARRAESGLTIGHFHDGLRTLHERREIALHPWTGPLYEIPEPAVALLVGHAIAYYAALEPRSRGGSLAAIASNKETS
jgi:hypothetical protein